MTSGRLRAILDRRVGERGVAGLATATGDRPCLESAWIPDTLAEEPAFLGYSLTKTLIAILVLRLVEEGRLSLDDRLERWLPQNVAAERISLRHLLQHRSGLPDYGALPTYHSAVRRSPSAPWPFDRFAAETLDRGLRFEPGTGWEYSNLGYMLLKRIVEEVTGRGLGQLIACRITRPLELRRTFVPSSVEDLSALAPAPSRILSLGDGTLDTRGHYHPGWVSHGVVASTPSELARLFHALFYARLLSPSSLREMTTPLPVPEAPPPWREAGYGLGLMADLGSPWGPIWGHGGGGPGYAASALHAPGLANRGVTVCAMCAVEEDTVAERLTFEALATVAPR